MNAEQIEAELAALRGLIMQANSDHAKERDALWRELRAQPSAASVSETEHDEKYPRYSEPYLREEILNPDAHTPYVTRALATEVLALRAELKAKNETAWEHLA